MGCGDECPLIPGVERDDWPLEDPKGKPAETVARIRDEIQKRVVELVTERKWGDSRSRESVVGSPSQQSQSTVPVGSPSRQPQWRGPAAVLRRPPAP